MRGIHRTRSGSPEILQREVEVAQNAMQGARRNLATVSWDGGIAVRSRDAIEVVSGACPDEGDLQPAQSPTQFVVGQTYIEFARSEREPL